MAQRSHVRTDLMGAAGNQLHPQAADGAGLQGFVGGRNGFTARGFMVMYRNTGGSGILGQVGPAQGLGRLGNAPHQAGVFLLGESLPKGILQNGLRFLVLSKKHQPTGLVIQAVHRLRRRCFSPLAGIAGHHIRQGSAAPRILGDGNAGPLVNQQQVGILIHHIQRRRLLHHIHLHPFSTLYPQIGFDPFAVHLNVPMGKSIPKRPGWELRESAAQGSVQPLPLKCRINMRLIAGHQCITADFISAHRGVCW